MLKNNLKRALIFLVSLYVLLGVLLYFFQEKILFLPTPLDYNYQFEFKNNFEELFFNTPEDGLINAIHFKVDEPKGVILYLHGNAGNLDRWGKITEYFVDQQYDVLIMDYRTYGKSQGKLSENVFYTDAQYCYDYLLKNYSENDITLYGRSLGTGIASYVASKNNPKQLILETPYYSIPDAASHRFPIYPVKQLINYEFPTYKFLEETNCKVTILHGTDDQVVPYSSAKKLTVLDIENLEFITIKGGNHNNLIQFEKYRNTISTLLK
jgi:pimeloyl-ACP methyl ester carboxylesterase